MTATDAVSFLVRRFPALKPTVDEDDLWESPHIAYGLLATEVLDKRTNSTLEAAARFIDELADSSDMLLEELLVIDVLEGIAQDADVARLLRAKITPKSQIFLERVEREFFGRS